MNISKYLPLKPIKHTYLLNLSNIKAEQLYIHPKTHLRTAKPYQVPYIVILIGADNERRTIITQAAYGSSSVLD